MLQPPFVWSVSENQPNEKEYMRIHENTTWDYRATRELPTATEYEENMKKIKQQWCEYQENTAKYWKYQKDKNERITTPPATQENETNAENKKPNKK